MSWTVQTVQARRPVASPVIAGSSSSSSTSSAPSLASVITSNPGTALTQGNMIVPPQTKPPDFTLPSVGTIGDELGGQYVNGDDSGASSSSSSSSSSTWPWWVWLLVGYCLAKVLE